MKIEKIKVSQINPAPYNPRLDLKPGDDAYERLKTSVTAFGYVDPIIWNVRTGNLVGGHQRYKVLIEQGLPEVDVSVVDLPLEEEKALNLALNKIQGDWDEDKLAVLLEELTKTPDFNMDLTGFDQPEISSILDNHHKGTEDDPPIIEAPTKDPVTHKGDLIVLGKHRLLCGDSSNADDVARLMGDTKVHLIFMDPPYNVNYSGEDRPIPESARSDQTGAWEKISNDNLPQFEYEAWLKKVLTNSSQYLEKGASLYIWNGHRQFGPMYTILTDLGIHVSCVITWAKESFALGYGDYNQQTEFCLYGWKEDNGAHKWYGPTNESTLWQVDRESTTTYKHPTQKPLLLAKRAICNSSQRGDIVLDMFLGSGTTLIMAEELERVCYGMEIDPGYCDVIVKRYIDLVGADNVNEEIKDRYLKEVTNG